MSELKAYKMVNAQYLTDRPCVIPADVYFKSEADKVIAEKDAVIAGLKRENKRLEKEASCTFADDCLRLRQTKRKLRRQKYKRCLAMAKWCERKRIDAANYRIPRQKWDFYDKWHKRWLALAEKFNEAK